MKEHIVAIIPGGGSGNRMGLGYPKQFFLLAGVPVFIHTLRTFQDSPLITEIIAVTPQSYLKTTKQLVRKFKLDKVTAIVPGGRKRQDSTKAGLDRIPEETRLVVIHDAARPLVSPETIRACIDAALESQAAIAALPIHDTTKEADENQCINKTIDRSHLWQAQTPQVMGPKPLREAMLKAEKKSWTATDEASLLELVDVKVRLVKGSAANIKITRPEDLFLAEALIAKRGEKLTEPCPSAFKIGQGYDTHRLVEGRDLILGGVTIPHDKGLLGHSDADVLTHALCDAILGALGLGDIGRHFPDSNPTYKNIASIKLLKEVTGMAATHGYRLGNCDITVVAQAPMLGPYCSEMRENLAAACRVTPEAINLKATTTEKMGFTGRGEGISAYATVLLQTEASSG